MILDRLEIINETFDADAVTPDQLDHLLANGWRHFGTRFFRYNFNVYRDRIVRVLPLRIRLDEFRVSKSQRRILRRNSDVLVSFDPANVDIEVHRLFEKHKVRFHHGVPDSIYDFLSREPATMPCECRQIAVRNENGNLIAISYFDVGETSTSAIYGCFDTDKSDRSLGIFTMLKVIEFSIAYGKQFYHHGYAYNEPSFYDYKKRFSGIEEFDWHGNWERKV